VRVRHDDESPSPRMLTAHEVADRLHVSLRTVRRLIAQEKLAMIRIGRTVRIAPEALAALIGA
jgi:excisionase family DNA binding protein